MNYRQQRPIKPQNAGSRYWLQRDLANAEYWRQLAGGKVWTNASVLPAGTLRLAYEGGIRFGRQDRWIILVALAGQCKAPLGRLHGFWRPLLSSAVVTCQCGASRSAWHSSGQRLGINEARQAAWTALARQLRPALLHCAGCRHPAGSG